MKKYLSLMLTAGMLGMLAGCDCTDDSCAATNAMGQAGDSGVVLTDVVTSEQMGAQLGQKTHVYFDFDKSNIKPEAQASLEEQAGWLKANPNVAVEVAGHCDERGTREYNLALGERRANAVKAYLVSEGIDASRITTISYGKDKPLVLGSGPQVWAQNRVAITGQNPA